MPQVNALQRAEQETCNIYNESYLEDVFRMEKIRTSELTSSCGWVKEDRSKNVEQSPIRNVLDVEAPANPGTYGIFYRE